MHVDEGRPIIFYLVLKVPKRQNLERIKRIFSKTCLELEEPVVSDKTGIAFSCKFHLASVCSRIFVSATYDGIVSVLAIDNLYPFRNVQDEFNKFIKLIMKKIKRISKHVEVLKVECIDLGPNLASWARVRFP